MKNNNDYHPFKKTQSHNPLPSSLAPSKLENRSDLYTEKFDDLRICLAEQKNLERRAKIIKRILLSYLLQCFL